MEMDPLVGPEGVGIGFMITINPPGLTGNKLFMYLEKYELHLTGREEWNDNNKGACQFPFAIGHSLWASVISASAIIIHGRLRSAALMN